MLWTNTTLANAESAAIADGVANTDVLTCTWQSTAGDLVLTTLTDGVSALVKSGSTIALRGALSALKTCVVSGTVSNVTLVTTQSNNCGYSDTVNRVSPSGEFVGAARNNILDKINPSKAKVNVTVANNHVGARLYVNGEDMLDWKAAAPNAGDFEQLSDIYHSQDDQAIPGNKKTKVTNVKAANGKGDGVLSEDGVTSSENNDISTQTMGDAGLGTINGVSADE